MPRKMGEEWLVYEALGGIIDRKLPEAESKIWHARGAAAQRDGSLPMASDRDLAAALLGDDHDRWPHRHGVVEVRPAG